MKPTFWLLLLVFATTLLVLALRNCGGDARPISTPTPAVEPDAAPARTTTATAKRATPASPERTALAPEERSQGPVAPAPNVPPNPFVIRGRVVLLQTLEELRGAGVELRLTDASGRSRITRADGGGEYSFPDLAPGTWWLACTEDGHQSVMARLELSPTEPMAQHDIELHPEVVLNISVLAPDGRRIEESAGTRSQLVALYELRAVATREPPLAYLFGVRGGRVGVGRFGGGYPPRAYAGSFFGDLTLDVAPPVYASLVLYQSVVATQRVEPGTEEVVFVVTPEELRERLSALRVRVVDAETGAPLPDVQVGLTGGISSRSIDRSNADGRISLDARPPGKHTLSLTASDGAYAIHRREILLEPGETLDLGTILMGRAIKISGTVVDEAGAPLSVTVKPERVGAALPRADVLRHWRTSSGKGVFELSGLELGEYLLSVGNLGQLYASTPVPVDARGGSVSGLRLVARRAAPLVLLPPTEGWRALQVRVADTKGHEVLRTHFDGPTPHAFPLAPSEYLLYVFNRAGEELSARLLTLTAEPLNIDLAR